MVLIIMTIPVVLMRILRWLKGVVWQTIFVVDLFSILYLNVFINVRLSPVGVRLGA
jgi:hypothetical protein